MALKSVKEELSNKRLKDCVIARKQVLVSGALLADGAISTDADNVILSKTSAAAMTLAAPTLAQNGREITIIAGTAFAHVVTATGLLDDGVIGGSKNTVTLGAFVGSAVTLMAYNLKWIVKSKTVATVA